MRDKPVSERQSYSLKWKMEKNDLFFDRYRSHLATPGFGLPGQEALAASRVLIIGGGGLTSPILSYLASMGFGTIGIIAHGRISQADLPSQPILFFSHEGKLQGQSAAAQVRELNPGVKVHLHEELLSNKNILSITSEYDVIVNTSENEQECLLINDACVIQKKPMVYGRIFSPSGYFAVFNFKGGATFRCMLQDDKIRSIVSQEPQYGLAILAGITGSFMACEVVKIVGEIGDVAINRLQVINPFNNQLNSLRIEPVPLNQNIKILQHDYSEPGREASSAPSPIRSISPKLLALKIRYKEALQLIDIREEAERHAENEWNFLHIPESQLPARHKEIHEDIAAILISKDGNSAKRLCALLNERYGFDNIYYLEGGYAEWQKEGRSAGITYESF